MDIAQNNACGFELINVVGDISADSLQVLLQKFDRFGEMIGVTENAFAFNGHSVLTVCDETSFQSNGEVVEFCVTPKINEADIAFLWGSMVSMGNEQLAKKLLYNLSTPEEAGPILNRRWGMIEKSIESMVSGILAAAIEQKASKAGLVRLKEVISEIAWSKSNSEIMMVSKPMDKVIPVLTNAYLNATQEVLSEDSVMAITALLSMRNECLEWIFTTHKYKKSIASPTDYLFRLSETERLTSAEVDQFYDFSIGGLMSYRVSLETGVTSSLARRFLPTKEEYLSLKDKLDIEVALLTKNEVENEVIGKSVRRIR